MKSHTGRSVFLSQDRIERTNADGAWLNKTLAEVFDVQVEKAPDRVAVVSYSDSSNNKRRSLTFHELQLMSMDIARDLTAKGIGLGDIVSMQLPNRHEALAICIACARIGAVVNPLMPVLRQRELDHILKLTEASILYVPNEFRGFGFAKMAHEIVGDVPTLKHVQTLNTHGFEVDITGVDNTNPDWNALIPDPNELFQIMFTSGTTGEPKGVMHTANTLLANVVQLQRRFEVDEQDVIHCPTPVAHQLGFLFGVLLPCLSGAQVVFQEAWRKDQALEIIEKERATICVGATPFLADLATHSDLESHDIDAFRLFVSGGAPIPSALVEDGVENLAAKVISVWGMTEVLAITTVRLDDPNEKASGSDGAATRHAEIRIVDSEGALVPTGAEGRLEARGPTICVGYLKRPALFTPKDGWFDTGDLARMDKDSYIRITGRSKDIIIRGGENIPVVEIEGLLFKHPNIHQVGIVAMPDARLGERGCAFATLATKDKLTLQDVQKFLLNLGVSKSFLPERLEIVDTMPMTATGKIQKFELREMAKMLSPEQRAG
ncbi:AMP-binding protein [Ruegeria sp. EL01]|uniref:AMP-binding protein n=1 Tax=Ruegeria sp. EL01 TaxID=2107578 RepID=UPI000EA7F717|nr:AMP-binding protein [Ruegeria sp. EL01]